MPRRPRHDHPGCLHHVMNRGLACRTIFETRAPAGTPSRLYRRHVEALNETAYRAVYAALVRRAIEALHGPGEASQIL